MISFVVPTINKEILTKNIKQSKIFKDSMYKFILKENYSNVRKALNEGFSESTTKWVAFIHEDVFLYDEFEKQLVSSIQQLEKVESNIGVLGVAGVIWKTNNNVKKYVGAVNDRGGKNWGNPQTSENAPFIKVETLDELLLIVPNEDWVLLDESQPGGHHLYGAELCFRATDAGKQNYAVWAYCFHNAKWYKGDIVKELTEFSKSLKPEFKKHFPFATTCGIFI